MRNFGALAAIVAASFAITGCQNTQQQLDQEQQQATQVALARGQFELNCPGATAIVEQRMMQQPAIEGPLVRGIERAVYTIGVSGCNQRKSYVVVCPQDGSGCFAAESQP